MSQTASFCPSCGNPVPPLNGANAAFCPGCGGSLTVAGHTQINLGPNVHNLLGLARTAQLGGNASEAYDYAAKVLESDPRNVDAWLIKAESAGWMSTLVELRLHEMVVGIQAALSFADADTSVTDTAVISINNVGVAVHDMSLRHVCDFPDMQTWSEHIGRCMLLLETFDFALSLVPDNRQMLDNCLIVGGGLIEGVRYTTFNGSTDVLHLTPSAQAEMQARIDSWSALIRAMDPAFLTPRPQAQSSCFVVTATMGSETALPVRYLRDFRDDVLRETSWGRAFIDWYYERGPGLADLVRGSRPRRAAAFVLVVVPGMALAVGVRVTRAVAARVRR